MKPLLLGLLLGSLTATVLVAVGGTADSRYNIPLVWLIMGFFTNLIFSMPFVLLAKLVTTKLRINSVFVVPIAVVILGVAFPILRGVVFQRWGWSDLGCLALTVFFSATPFLFPDKKKVEPISARPYH